MVRFYNYQSGCLLFKTIFNSTLLELLSSFSLFEMRVMSSWVLIGENKVKLVEAGL
jgi:hypothetical protein